MESYTFITNSLADIEKLGLLLGSKAEPGFVYCLDGDLGAGKTTLTQSIARGLNLTDGQYVSSPSFAVLHEYDGEIPLYHMDFYRLYGADDVLSLGFDEYFFKTGLTVIEWSKRATEVLPEETLSLEVLLTTDGSRVFTLLATPIYLSLLKEIKNLFPR